MGEGDKAVEHTVTSEKATTVSKNDIGKGTHTETKTTNKSEIDGKRTTTHTSKSTETERRNGNVTTKTQDTTTKRYETKKVDDKLATGRMKTNASIGGQYKESEEAKATAKARAQEKIDQKSSKLSDDFLKNLGKTADDLNLRGW